ncbi:MAG TPA: hypothetical protein VMV70_01695 [Gallionella sp.]|nr:hypothetical protein [Gallionella sp.]HUW75367.1 hypothetical protein [Gallionella sp.]
MNEFEWRRQLRDLQQPLKPRRDLWISIDAALADAAPGSTRSSDPLRPRLPEHRRRWLLGAGLAASALLVAGMGWRLLHAPAGLPLVASTPPTMSAWKPTDPRLVGAAIELDAARMELQQALRQAPGSAALQRLLARTERQQTQLRQSADPAG